MNIIQEATTVKTILKSAKSVLELLGDEHPLNATLSQDLEDLIEKVDGPFPTDGDEC